jgi:RimJ/RimL family protein N-acetyltransferase
LGTEVTEILTYYGFDRLNLNRIYLGFTAENKGAGKAYEKAGYRQEGILKEDIYRNSRYYDSVRMAILRKDYYKDRHNEHKLKFSGK